MALRERFFPIMHIPSNFFAGFAQEMDREFADMDRMMNEMRNQMFQLIPRDMTKDIEELTIKPTIPIVESKGQTKLKLEFDVHSFKPEEIQVKVMGNNLLQIEALHEMQTDSSFEKYSYYRQYQLPKGINPDDIKPSLSKDGVLTIEAPAPALQPAEKLIPIDFK